jgi:hypothetical protein
MTSTFRSISSAARKPVRLAVRGAQYDRGCLPIDVAEVTKTVDDRIDALAGRRSSGVQDADARESARILCRALPRRDENADREDAEKRAPIHH